MDIELKKIKVSASLSRETTAYTAEIWIDGVKRGTVENHGTGGSDCIFPHALEEEINDYAAALPTINRYGLEFIQDASVIFADIIEKHLNTKKLTRMLRSKIVMTKDGKLYTCKTMPAPKQLEGFTVLNNMSFDDAFRVFEKCLEQ